MTEQVNKTLSMVERVFKSTVVDSVTDLELAALMLEFKWLAVWPFRPIVMTLGHFWMDRFYARFTKTVDVEAVPFINQEHKREWERDVLKLKIISVHSGEDSEEFRKAQDDADAAFAQFVRDAG